MKIAIHHREGSFSEYWIKYCQDQSIEYKLVDAYKTNIVQQLVDCDIFMWHHDHINYKDVLFAKQLLFSLQVSGIKVFPDINTGTLFDDKVGQKYLLESIKAPIVPSYVFYSRVEALEWALSVKYPKVFKLRGGASAFNVSLVKDVNSAKKLINKAFTSGFSNFNRQQFINERWKALRHNKISILAFCKSFARCILSTEFAKYHGREKGYIYFQEFIPNNAYDIRLIVIGDKAYGMKRLCRENDFRASGSGNFVYDKIDDEILRIAFSTASKLSLQSVAFDFIYDIDGSPLIVEMSYGYGTKGSSKCKGYWTRDLVWHEETFNPFAWQIENLISNKG